MKSASQSQAFSEIIVVDDASPDLPAGWKEKVQAVDPRVRVILLQKNGGCSFARNEGLKAMKGTHFMILDDDDALLAHGVNRLWNRAKASEEEVWLGMVQTEEGGRITGRRWPASTRKGEIWGLDEFRLNGKFFSWHVKQSAIIPKRIIDEVGAFDKQFHIRQWTEMFYRLSLVAPVRRIFSPVYLLNRDGDLDRLTAHSDEREADFKKLVAKHHRLLKAVPGRMQVLSSNHKEQMARSAQK